MKEEVAQLESVPRSFTSSMLFGHVPGWIQICSFQGERRTELPVVIGTEGCVARHVLFILYTTKLEYHTMATQIDTANVNCFYPLSLRILKNLQAITLFGRVSARFCF